MKSRMNFLRFMSVTISLISLFLLTTDSHAENKTENKIVYLISPPRSLSVAFLRMMEARGDFTTMNEPSQWAYNVIENYEMAKPWFKNDAPQTFDEVKQIIFKKAFSFSLSFFRFLSIRFSLK